MAKSQSATNFSSLLKSFVGLCLLPAVLAISLPFSVNVRDQVRFPSLVFPFGVSLFTQFVNSGSVTDSLLSKLKSEGRSDAVLELPSIFSSVVSNPLLKLLPGDLKTSILIKLLKNLTFFSQAPIISVINKLGYAESTESFWITNKLSIKNASRSLVRALSRLLGTFTLREPKKIKLVQPAGSSAAKLMISTYQPSTATPEWGVVRIGAPEIWESTTTGENVIIAGIDTGVLREHAVLVNNYAGGWLDAISEKTEPYDDHGHGTHTMGTIVGQFGIGVAPGAKWIACKGLDIQGIGDDITLSQCAEFVLNFKPTPKVVCNAWGSTEPNSFFNNDEIAAWQIAKIIPIFAIGNSGPNCSTVWSPAEQLNLISVGATDFNDKIANSSSRGYGIGRKTKPEVSAPGVSIVSAFNKGINSYSFYSGSSMAAPHVAGAVALMLSANPMLEFKDILNKLQTTAFRPELEESDLRCGPTKQKWPNNAYGYGRINVKDAIADQLIF